MKVIMFIATIIISAGVSAVVSTSVFRELEAKRMKEFEEQLEESEKTFAATMNEMIACLRGK